MTSQASISQSSQTTAVNSLGFAKQPCDTRVVVAMSGGVDSSVVAAMLKDEGYEVIGITMQLYDHGVAIDVKGACCAGADIHDARSVAARLDIPHYVLDYESLFKSQVMEEFADSYLKGHTPIPCVRCNQTVKFKDLLKMARDLGADCLATGHYVRREYHHDTIMLKKGVDETKDQSYFLFATTTEQLDYVRFPLGSMTKDATRQLAKKYDLIVSDKPDSQDICFVPNGRYGDVVRKLRPGAVDKGEIVHLDGTVLGTHNGVIDYTIGQRRGLGIGGRKEAPDDEGPLYVVAIDASAHQVIVGPKEALAVCDVYLSDCNWLVKDRPVDMPLWIRLRNTGRPVAGVIKSEVDGLVHLRLDSPQYGVACG
ncbi:MAG: tRNA 2-thiouridine(34) synthase MnmA, partial [Candidatus Puniceispirillaceae bacterium]